jgi:hypothetical protein
MSKCNIDYLISVIEDRISELEFDESEESTEEDII